MICLISAPAAHRVQPKQWPACGRWHQRPPSRRTSFCQWRRKPPLQHRETLSSICHEDVHGGKHHAGRCTFHTRYMQQPLFAASNALRCHSEVTQPGLDGGPQAMAAARHHVRRRRRRTCVHMMLVWPLHWLRAPTKYSRQPD